jgi:tetratricopeptide (TPR) repeat protein
LKPERITFCSICLLALSLGGCAGTNVARIPDAEMSAYLADKPPQYRNEYSRLYEEGKSNEALNYMRLGVTALKRDDRDTAQKSFDNVLQNIEAFYVDTDAAKKARSLWYEEGMKDFKGEPYERVMAYYYRGLLFLNAGDYENARAAFKSAVLQDAFAEEEQYRADFALVIFLEAVASQAAGDPEGARSAFAELKKLRPDLEIPADYNTIFIVETGNSPRKVADGPGHAELKYFRGRDFTEKKVEIRSAGASAQNMYPLEDIYFQASSRGGRQIDKILKDKIVFRQTNLEMGSTLSNAANTAILLAPLTGAQGTVTAVAGGVAVVGALQQYIAINAKPHADTRFWNNLPDTVHIAFAKLPPGKSGVKIVPKDQNGQPVAGIEKTVQFEVSPQKKLSVVWAKVR